MAFKPNIPPPINYTPPPPKFGPAHDTGASADMSGGHSGSINNYGNWGKQRIKSPLGAPAIAPMSATPDPVRPMAPLSSRTARGRL